MVYSLPSTNTKVISEMVVDVTRFIFRFSVPVSFVFLSLAGLFNADVYNFGEEPKSCGNISTLPPQVEGWQYITCKQGHWIWASVNQTTEDDIEWMCHGEIGHALSTVAAYQDLELDSVRLFLDMKDGPRKREILKVMNNLSPKNTFWYGNNAENSIMECPEGKNCKDCEIIEWSKQKQSYHITEADCEEKHHALCFGAFDWDM